VPVWKFRSVAEMPRPAASGNATLASRIRALWKRARRLAPPVIVPRGVARFRSIEEAHEARTNATLRRMLAWVRRARASGATPC
jgi:hypothetical protein